MRYTVTLLALAAVLAGCSTFDRGYDREVTQDQVVLTEPFLSSNTNRMVTANFGGEQLQIPVLSPERVGDGITINTQGRSIAVTTDGSNLLYSLSRTNLVNKPVVDSALQTVGTFPVPWAGVIAGILGWGYSAYRSVRNKKAAQAVVSGAEQVRKILQDTPEGRQLDLKVREILQDHQVALGVADEVAKLVKRYTGTTRKTV